GKVAKAQEELKALSGPCTALQITGKDKTARVTYVLQGVSLRELLDRANRDVMPPREFKVFYSIMREELGLTSVRGFREEDTANEGDLAYSWRGTNRRAHVRFWNIRELA